MDALDENTKTAAAAVLAACEHVRRDRKAKADALAHPEMTPELGEILSTSELQLTYETTTALETE